LAPDGLRSRREELGPLLESFVYAEILRLRTADPVRVSPYHFRDHDGHEVDVVLEREDGSLAGIEGKEPSMERVVHKSKSHEEALRWDIE
jgi:predicted AAA+ superfamily ATPase